MNDDSSFRRSLGSKDQDTAQDAVSLVTPPPAIPAAPKESPAHDPLLGEDVQEAQFEEAPSVAMPHTSASKEAVGELSQEGPSPRRRFVIIAGGVILLLAVIIALAGGSKPTTATNPTAPKIISTTPATPVKPAKPAKPTPAVPVTSAKPIAPGGGGGGGTHPPGKVTLPGLPTAKEKADAKQALDFGVKTITSFSGVHCVGPNFHLAPGQTRTGYLVANPGELQCNILTDTGYQIKVVSTSPKPFDNGHQGELSATFAPQAGFILLYTTAGKLGIPYSHEVKIS